MPIRKNNGKALAECDLGITSVCESEYLEGPGMGNWLSFNDGKVSVCVPCASYVKESLSIWNALQKQDRIQNESNAGVYNG